MQGITNKSYLLHSNKNYMIQNESVYVCMKYHSSQSLFTQLSLHSLKSYSDFHNF
jgi:hypothetical protein